MLLPCMNTALITDQAPSQTIFDPPTHFFWSFSGWSLPGNVLAPTCPEMTHNTLLFEAHWVDPPPLRSWALRRLSVVTHHNHCIRYEPSSTCGTIAHFRKPQPRGWRSHPARVLSSHVRHDVYELMPIHVCTYILTSHASITHMTEAIIHPVYMRTYVNTSSCTCARIWAWPISCPRYIGAYPSIYTWSYAWYIPFTSPRT